MYVYDAAGTKLRKTVGSTVTDYAGNFIYENNVLQFFNQPEGYVEPSGSNFNYVYQYKDHLGNIRLSYSDKNNDGVITASTEIKEENNYYPFGLKHKGYNANINGRHHKYMFGGKEQQDELGLNWYDITARNYDPALGRWMNLDPLAEKMRRHSPYNYAFDNPIFFIDPDGMAPQANDWIPNVDNEGNISYVAEAGDSSKSLSNQFGIKQGDAEKITGTIGDTKIEEGTAVTGKKVASVIKGNSNGILKLDTTNKDTTDSDIINQATFAIRNENVQERLGNAGADGKFFQGNLYDYFKKPGNLSDGGTHYGFITNHRKPSVFKVGSNNFLLSLSIGGANNGNFATSIGKERQVLQSDGNYAIFQDFNYPRVKNQSTKGIKSLTGKVMTIKISSGDSGALKDYLYGN